jgi:hypothetical protein
MSSEQITRFFTDNHKMISAKEIAAMPYPKCKNVLAEQVVLHRKNAQMGEKAKALLLLLRGAEKISLVEIKAKKNSCFYLNQEPIDSVAVRQLMDRGYII